MNVLYLADIRLPLERANGIQTMETCHALARRGHDVTLLVRPDTHTPARDPLAFYGLAPDEHLTIARVTVPVRPAGPLGQHVRRAHYLAAALAHALRGRSVGRRTHDTGAFGARELADRSVAGSDIGARDDRAEVGGAGGRGRGAGGSGARGIDIVFTRDLGLASLLLRVPRGMRPPVVYESHGYAPVVSGLLPEMLSTAPKASRAKAARLAAREQRVWTLADGYVTITTALARDLAGRLGDRADVAIVPDGVRLDPARRFAWDGPSPRPVAVYAGHLYPWKGVDTLIAALAHAPSLRARIIGGHPAEPDLGRLQQQARDLGVADRVEFAGLQPPPAVAALLLSADALVLPNHTSSVSAHYTSPLKLFEYLAAGRPIVASDLPALREVLRHGENAWLTPPGDPAALAASLTHVTSDVPLALRLARTAFDEATGYSWERRAEQLEAVLEQAAAAAPRARTERRGPR
jgi:glycosyltransferase involved in cell wall biosynthesis